MRRHLTYANVVATLALVVAVGGGSTAIAISAKKAPKNSVTSASIRKDSVTTSDIRDGSVTASDLAEVRVTSLPFFNTVNCGAGEKLLGGGAIAVNASGQEVTQFDNYLQRSYPVTDGLSQGWRAQGLDNARAYALCLAATPGK